LYNSQTMIYFRTILKYKLDFSLY